MLKAGRAICKISFSGSSAAGVASKTAPKGDHKTPERGPELPACASPRVGLG
jgi:hypothetical protein